MADKSNPTKLFAQVFYALSDSVEENKRKQLTALLNANGGQVVPISDPRLTHFITTVLPHAESQSLDGLPSDTPANFVTPLWVERTVVLNSTQDPAGYSPDPALLFSGIIASATDLAPSDLEVLSAGITALGGQWRSGLTKEVTHLFALSKGSPKYETAIKFQKTINIKVLVPHWFDDSVRLGIRGLPTESYEWPSPTVFKVGWEALQNEERRSSAADMSPEKKALYETLLTEPGQDPELQVSKAAPRNVWNGKRLLLADDLGLLESPRRAHEVDIEREGGVVVRGDENVEDADIVVTKYRAGPTYVKAFRLKKMIGSLSWLWYVRSTGKFSRPTEQLLHYPIPKKAIERFSNHMLTITNYTGKDREYLKKLITTLGGGFTPSMTGKNTVVIAAYHQGTKTEKAVAWGIPVVNHLWLEDCFVNWRNLTTTNEKYTCFPPGVDFGSMLGGKGIGRVGYDKKELDAMEKDVERVDKGETSPTKTPAKTPGRGKGKEREVRKSTSMKEVEDVIFAEGGVGDVSVGGVHEVELDADAAMDVDEDDPFGGPSKGKGKARALSPKRPPPSKKHKPESDVVVLVTTKPPQTPSSLKAKMKMKTPSSRKTRARDVDEEDAMEVDEEDEPKTQPTPTPKRGRGRPRKSETVTNGDGESPVKRGRGWPRKNGSVSRSRARAGAGADAGDQSEVDENGPLKRGRGRPRKSQSRSRPRPTTLSDSDHEVEEVEEQEGEVGREKRGPGRPRKVPYDGPTPSPRRTRSQSRARAEKGKGKVLPPLGTADEDGEDSDVQVVDVSGPLKTPVSTKKRGRPPGSVVKEKEKEKRGKIEVESESEESEDDVPWAKPTSKGKEKPKSKVQLQSQRGRKANTPIEIDTDSDDDKVAKKKNIATVTPGQTPKKKLSVVVPSREQAYSNDNVGSSKQKNGTKIANVSPQRGRPRLNGASSSKSRQAHSLSTSPSPSGRSPSPSPAKAGKKPKSKQRPQTPSPGPSTSTHRRRVSGGGGGVEETPAQQRSPSRRSAATKATQKLRDEVMPDMNQFQKQLKRGVMKGSWEDEQKAREKAEKEKAKVISATAKGKKRAGVDDQDESASDDERERKRLKVVKTGGKLNQKDPASIVIMTTQVTLTDDVRRSMTRLGVQFTTNPTECTHLVAKSLVRTEKFLCAMANAPIVVTDKWIETCTSTHHLLIEDDFLLSDPVNEKKFGVDLKRALERARSSSGKLFEGMTFYITAKVPVGAKLLKNVITAGGGKVGSGTPTVRILKTNSERFVISCVDDKAIWRPLAEAGYTVYNQELILTGMLKQEIDWENEGHKVPGQ